MTESILKKHYKKIGSKGGKSNLEKNGVAFFKKISKKAVIARKKNKEERERIKAEEEVK